MTAPSVAGPEALGGPAPRGERDRKESMLRQMEARREPKMPRWRDIQAFIAPYAANIDPTAKQYEQEAFEVLDESIFYARSTLASFLYSGMTNPARQWRQWVLPDPDLMESQAAKEWTYTVNERAATLLAHSNFYEVMAGLYDEWPTFGTSVVLIEEDDVDVFHYVHLNIGSYALADDHRGRCHAISRRFMMTVEQLVSRFCPKGPSGEPVLDDLSMFSSATRKLITDGQWSAEVEVAHLISRNPKPRVNAVRPQDFAWSSDYWEYRAPKHEGRDGFIVREGYREWPAMVFRWRRLSGDPYGVDYPGVQSLMAVKSAQQLESDMLMQVETQARPPLTVPNELTGASLLPAARNAVDTRPGMIVAPTHVTDANAIFRTSEVQTINRDRIFAMWWTRLILALTGAESGTRTAREVDEISTEKLTVLGRVVEAAQSAFQAGSDREFAIMARRGLLPPAPEELQGKTLAIEYTSALAQAMKSLGLNNLINYAMATANVFKATGEKAVIERTDWSQWAQELGQRSGIPPKVQRSDEQVEARAAAEAEAMAAMQRAEQGRLEAEAASKLASADTSGKNALTDLLSSGNAGALAAPTAGMP